MGMTIFISLIDILTQEYSTTFSKRKNFGELWKNEAGTNGKPAGSSKKYVDF
jgi:hypothetical protein